MTGRVVRLGTRGSALARAQAGAVAAWLESAGITAQATVITTMGDRHATGAFDAIGPSGVFVRELEQALIEDRIDAAVHSLKDLPTTERTDLVIAAVPRRFDPADVLLVRRDAIERGVGDWLPLGPRARVGTAATRRERWLRYFRPDLIVVSLRGNVTTRVQRLVDGELDAIVLAAAGVARLRASGHLEEALRHLELVRLDPALFVPAPAQGALAVQCRRDAPALADVLAGFDHGQTRTEVQAERAAMARVGGGCSVPFGALCRRVSGGYSLTAMYEQNGSVDVAHAVGQDVNDLAADVCVLLNQRSAR